MRRDEYIEAISNIAAESMADWLEEREDDIAAGTLGIDGAYGTWAEEETPWITGDAALYWDTTEEEAAEILADEGFAEWLEWNGLEDMAAESPARTDILARYWIMDELAGELWRAFGDMFTALAPEPEAAQAA